MTKPALWTKDFILIMLVNTLVFLSFQMISPCLPLHVKNLGASEELIGLIAGSFTLTAVCLRPFVGRILDTKGRKGIYLLGLIIIIMSLIAYPFASSLWAIATLRLLHGAGWAAGTTASGTIATDCIPKERMGEGMGFYGLTSVFAIAVAPAIGLTIMNRWNFTVMCLFAFALALIAAGVALLLHVQPIDSTHSGEKSPLFERQACMPAFLIFLINLVYGAVITFISIYALDLGIQNIGPFFFVYACTLFFSRPFFGRLVDRKGPRIAMITGVVCMTIALFLLAFAKSMPVFLLSAAIYGLGFGATSPTLQAMAVSGVPPHRRGAANSTFFIGFDLGIGVGAVIWGFVAEFMNFSMMYALNSAPLLLALLIYFVTSRNKAYNIG